MKRSPIARGTSTLDRSSPLVNKKPMARGTKPLAKVGARAKRTRQGKVPPNAAEAAWMAAVSQFCIVCWIQHSLRRPAEVHHLKSGDRRMGHQHSIGLCWQHHRGGERDGQFISRHPWKKRFEAAYGTELELLAAQRSIISSSSQ